MKEINISEIQDKLAETQKKKIETKKLERISIKDRAYQSFCGRRDGKHSIPRLDEKGNVYSPHIDKEIQVFENECSYQYAEHSRELQKYHRMAEDNLAWIEDGARRLKELRRNNPGEAGEDFLKVRKNGEEELTDSQIRERRGREWKRINKDYFEQVHSIESSLSEYYQALIMLRNMITEADNVTELIVERYKYRTAEALNIYWEEVLKFHPKGMAFPVKPDYKLDAVSRDIYKERHEKKGNAIEATIKMLRELLISSEDVDIRKSIEGGVFA
jgi:hypothetical protein